MRMNLRVFSLLALLALGGAGIQAQDDPFPAVINRYPGNMNVIARVEKSGEVVTSAIVAVYCGSELRGKEHVGSGTNPNLVYLSINGNSSQEQYLYFKVYTSGVVFTYSPDTKLNFHNNSIEGSSANPYIIDITPVSLSDNGDNTDVLTTYNRETCDVVLMGRSLTKDGKWNTLCLPFSLNSLAGTPLEGATVKTLASATYADGTLTLTFSDALTAIEAGKPYIVKWEGQTSGDVANPVFKGVTISNLYSPVEADAVSFVGIYAPYHIDGANEKLLYLDTDNKLNQPTTAMTVNAQRAYFQLASASDDSGDVNGDGEVNVADVTMLVDYILGKETVGFIIDNADVNGDGEINVTDVAALVNIILDSNNFVLENVVVTGADGISYGD